MTTNAIAPARRPAQTGPAVQPGSSIVDPSIRQERSDRRLEVSGTRQIEKMPPGFVLGFDDPDVRIEAQFPGQPLLDRRLPPPAAARPARKSAPPAGSRHRPSAAPAHTAWRCRRAVAILTNTAPASSAPRLRTAPKIPSVWQRRRYAATHMLDFNRMKRTIGQRRDRSQRGMTTRGRAPVLPAAPALRRRREPARVDDILLEHVA